MEYEYDVFISYKRGGVASERWVQEYFYPFLKDWLDTSLGKKQKIFMDTKEIRNGDDWKRRIKKSLAKSKCMIAILSPLYFDSEWCKAEFSIMLHREKTLGYRTDDKPDGLISGILIQEGENFPNIVQEMQCPNWKDYVRVGKGFESCSKFPEFQDRVVSYATSFAEIIRNVPPWDDIWMSREFLDDPPTRYSLDLLDNIIKQPLLF